MSEKTPAGGRCCPKTSWYEFIALAGLLFAFYCFSFGFPYLRAFVREVIAFFMPDLGRFSSQEFSVALMMLVGSGILAVLIWRIAHGAALLLAKKNAADKGERLGFLLTDLTMTGVGIYFFYDGLSYLFHRATIPPPTQMSANHIGNYLGDFLSCLLGMFISVLAVRRLACAAKGDSE